MDNLEIEGFVLSSIDFKEKSKIVYLYTKEGKISFKALSSNSPKKGMLPLITSMNKVSVILTNKEFPTSIDFTLINSYQDIKDDLKKSLWYSFILEIISKLPSDSPHERVYSLLDEIFNLRNKYDGLLLTTTFMVKMTYAFGVSPVLKKCVICNNPHPKYFSIKDGGALCFKHNHKDTYDNDILNALTNIYYIDIYKENLDSIKEYDMIKLFQIINIYYNNHVNIYLKGLNSLIF
jgi:DNA repair protein RecO (recombination protein O)